MIRNLILVICAITLLGQTDAFAQKKKKSTGDDEYIFKIDKRELDVQSLFIEAVNEKQMGNIEDAVDLFLAVLKLDPDNHAAYYELARMAYEANDLTMAEDYAQKAVKLNPKNEWYHIYLAESRAHKGDYIGAAESYMAIVDEIPGQWEYLQDVGYMYAKAEEYEKAIDVYDQLEVHDGITEPLSLQKQSLYLKLGKVEKAADEIRKAIAELPDRENLVILLGEIYEANGFHKKALDSYATLLDKDPNHPQALLATAEILRKSGNEEEYQETVRKVFGNSELDINTKIFMFIPYIELLAVDTSMGEEVLEMAELIKSTHPEDAKAQTAYADVLLNIGKQKEAIEAYKLATEYDESPMTVWIQLFDLLIQEEAYGEVIKYGNIAAERHPDDVVPWFYLGASCLQVKDYNCAVNNFSNGLKLETVNPELMARMWSSLGDAYNELQDHESSDSCYDEALVISPNDAFTLNNYAYYLSLREDQLKKAEKMSKRANLLVDDNSAFLDTYAWIMYKIGDYKVAKEWMEKAIAVMETQGPDRPVLLEHYGDILFKLGDMEAALDNWHKALDAGGANSTLEEKIKNKALLE
ncbi:MAG: tetratricopeptide repeat protein [Bacteroidetes bacterium]|nr:tetratricopeptide repeat protein [Bacteroidota bacterium]